MILIFPAGVLAIDPAVQISKVRCRFTKVILDTRMFGKSLKNFIDRRK